MPLKDIYRYIGVDFGTSTSVITYMDYEKLPDGKLKPCGTIPQSIQFGQNNSVVPTLIIEHGEEKGKKIANDIFGWDVLSQQNTFPKHLRKEFKMGLINESRYEEAVRLMELFFKYMSEVYKSTNVINKDWEIVEEVTYVSYPAKWTDTQRKATIEVANKYFKNVKGMSEPRAAMQYCLTTDIVKINGSCKKITDIWAKGEDINILLLDMGAGTTDIVIYRYKVGYEDKHEVLATYPTVEGRCFGGREVDLLIKQFYLNILNNIPLSNIQSIDYEMKEWKEKTISPVTKLDEKVDTLPSIIGFLSQVYPELDEISSETYTIDRKVLETKILNNYLYQFQDLINGALKDAKLKGDDIDLVICTGGHSQWYFVEQFLLDKPVGNIANKLGLGKIKYDSWRLIKTPYPQQIVAYGLSMNGMPIHVRARSANSVWFVISSLDHSETVEIIKKGQILPYESNSSFNVTGKYIPGSNINVNIKIYAGSTFNKAKFMLGKQVEVKFAFIWKVIDAVFRLDNETLNFNIDFSVDEEELIKAKVRIHNTFAREDVEFYI